MNDPPIDPNPPFLPGPGGTTEVPVDITAWLSAHPDIANSILWEDANGVHPWPSWSPDWKTELQSAFDLAHQGSSILVAEVPENQAILSDQDFPRTIITPTDAWAYYKASVAQALAIEVGELFVWRLGEYSAEQLAELFDSRQMFNWNASPAGYHINADIVHGWIVPAPPLFSYRFLVSTHMVATRSRLDTIANLLNWCRSNLQHFDGSPTAANMQDQWQYRGLPPMPRVIGGTIQTSQPQLGTHCRTAGCWGTTGLLRATLRAVNIPVKLVTNAGHAQPYFMADSLYLSHGDDPYDDLMTAKPPIPASQIPIDQATFDQWFGVNVSPADVSNNIGRQTVELALIYLPIVVQILYCADIAGGLAQDAGQVFYVFSPYYTMAELEAQDLWTRLAAKVASVGGCS